METMFCVVCDYALVTHQFREEDVTNIRPTRRTKSMDPLATNHFNFGGIWRNRNFHITMGIHHART